MSSKKRRKHAAENTGAAGGAIPAYFTVPGADTHFTQGTWKEGTLEWTRSHVHPQYGTECNPSAPWIRLTPGSVEHVRAVVVGSNYQGLDATGLNMNGRLCDVAHGEKRCDRPDDDCTWCVQNRMCLAPVPKGGSSKKEYVYGFVNCDSEYRTCRFPPHGEKFIQGVVQGPVKPQRVPESTRRALLAAQEP